MSRTPQAEEGPYWAAKVDKLVKRMRQHDETARRNGIISRNRPTDTPNGGAMASRLGTRSELRMALDHICASGRVMREDDFDDLQFVDDLDQRDRKKITASIIDETKTIVEFKANGYLNEARRLVKEVADEFDEFFDRNETAEARRDAAELDKMGPRELADRISNDVLPSNEQSRAADRQAQKRGVK